MTRTFHAVSQLLLGVFVVFGLAQCSTSGEVGGPSDPSGPFLSITQEPPAFNAPGGTAELMFSTNESWRITTKPLEGGAEDWYEVAPLSGAAGENVSVRISVQKNEKYTGRGFTLTLRGESESLKRKIEVTQHKKNVILLGDNLTPVTSAQQSLVVKVEFNVTYTVSVKQGKDWIREAPAARSSELETKEHTFLISANPDKQERTGIVLFKDANSDISDELTIVQAAWVEPDPERAALRAIYDAAGGGGWTQKENWCGDKPLGEWYGVQTDSEGHVTDLRLPKNNLSGTVSWDIAKLTKLRHLDLSRNALSGDITKKNAEYKVVSYLDELTEAETIDLSRNRLTGEFMPIDGNKLLRLKSLNLSFNQLKGFAFPLKWEPMFQNGRMVDLILNGNTLHDDVPDVIQNHGEWSRLALQFIRQSRDSNPGIDYTKDIRLPGFTYTDLRDGSQGNIRDVYSGNTLTMLLQWNPLQEDSNTFLETTVRRFHTLYGEQDFAVVAITPEGDEYREAAQAYLRGHTMPGPVVTDYADAQGRRIILPAEPYPSYLMVDQYGKVLKDVFTGQHCSTSLYPAEPFLFDLIARPFQHTDNLNRVFKDAIGHSKYQSTDFTMDKTFETLQRATKGKGIDIVLIGEAFTDVDIETGYYKQVMEFAMEAFFALEPTKSYREYFTVHMIYAVSRDAYIAKSGTNTALGVKIETSNQWFYINAAVNQLPDYYSVVGFGIPTIGVVINDTGGGVARLRSAVMGPSFAFTGFNGRLSFREYFIHETVGHGFGLLGDEYTQFGSDGKPQGEIPESEKSKLRDGQDDGLYLNLSLTDDPKSVYWSHLIGHLQYPYVGIYQGGYYYSKGVWRSESANSMFNQYYLYFNAICRELIVKRIMTLAGEEYTFEKFLAKDSDAGRRKSSTPISRQTNVYESERRHQPPIIGE